MLSHYARRDRWSWIAEHAYTNRDTHIHRDTYTKGIQLRQRHTAQETLIQTKTQTDRQEENKYTCYIRHLLYATPAIYPPPPPPRHNIKVRLASKPRSRATLYSYRYRVPWRTQSLYLQIAVLLCLPMAAVQHRAFPWRKYPVIRMLGRASLSTTSTMKWEAGDARVERSSCIQKGTRDNVSRGFMCVLSL